MAVDPHAEEKTVEIAADLYQQWLEVRELIKVGEAEEKRLRAEIEQALGDATAATVSGQKVITYRPKATYNTKGILRDYPELAEHFMTMRVENTFDAYQFAAHHPSIAEKYQTREFREVQA
jgi:hypothetical protein